MGAVLYLMRSLNSTEPSVEMTYLDRFSSCVSLVDQLVAVPLSAGFLSAYCTVITVAPIVLPRLCEITMVH